jgi:hypothetical protein
LVIDRGWNRPRPGRTEPGEFTWGGQELSHEEQREQFQERHRRDAEAQLEWEAKAHADWEAR